MSGCQTREENAREAQRDEARWVLVQACARDMQASLRDDPEFRERIAEEGFVGFDNMNDEDLIRATRDAGLDDHVLFVQDAIAVLSTP